MKPNQQITYHIPSVSPQRQYGSIQTPPPNNSLKKQNLRPSNPANYASVYQLKNIENYSSNQMGSHSIENPNKSFQQSEENILKEHEKLITELSKKLIKDKALIDLEIENFELECQIRKCKMSVALKLKEKEQSEQIIVELNQKISTLGWNNNQNFQVRTFSDLEKTIQQLVSENEALNEQVNTKCTNGVSCQNSICEAIIKENDELQQKIEHLQRFCPDLNSESFQIQELKLRTLRNIYYSNKEEISKLKVVLSARNNEYNKFVYKIEELRRQIFETLSESQESDKQKALKQLEQNKQLRTQWQEDLEKKEVKVQDLKHKLEEMINTPTVNVSNENDSNIKNSN